jgi:hypothetical protein
MRFVAIIGLCLAAIFSLLPNPEVTATVAATPLSIDSPPQPTAQAWRQPASTRLQQSPVSPDLNSDPGKSRLDSLTVSAAEPGGALPLAPEPDRASKPEPTSTEGGYGSRSPGFTLGFASAEALQVLLAGGTVTLFAASEEGYWRYLATRELFTASPPPREYYRMETATVPSPLRDWLQAAGVRTREWGVVLPPSLAQEVQQLMRGDRNGDLTIQASGEVRLVSPSVN